MNPRVRNLLWATAVLCVALLNIFDMLPDWSTFLAIFTLPPACDTQPS